MSEMIFGEVNSALAIFERFTTVLKRWKAKPVISVAQRFVVLFEAHGVQRNQIPRVFGNDLVLSDVVDDASLLPKLSEPVLDAACSLFGVRREWLEAPEEEPYVHHQFYKSPQDFELFIKELKGARPDTEMTGYVIVPTESMPRDQAFLILAEVVATLGVEPIYRYHVCDTWAFGYWKSRAYLTACVAIAWKNDVYISGRYADKRELSTLAGGANLPGPVVARLASSGRRWYAEDLALQPDLYLRDVDPEQDGFGMTSALSLWLMLDEEGWMDTGLKKNVRPAFEAMLGMCQAIE